MNTFTLGLLELLQYVASVGSDNNIRRQQKFYSLPKRYKQIQCFEALSPELVWGGQEKQACFYTSEYIKTTRDKIKKQSDGFDQNKQ